MDTEPIKKVLVAGDPTIDVYIYRSPAANSGPNWKLIESRQKLCLNGGVFLLAELVKEALREYHEKRYRNQADGVLQKLISNWQKELSASQSEQPNVSESVPAWIVRAAQSVTKALPDLWRQQLSEHVQSDQYVESPSPPDPEKESIRPTSFVLSHARLEQLKQGDVERWVVNEALGYLGPEKERTGGAAAAPPRNAGEQSGDKPHAAASRASNAAIQVIVLDDLGNGFRDDENLWPPALKEWGQPASKPQDGATANETAPQATADRSSVRRPIIVHKMRQPLDKLRASDPLWVHLKAGLQHAKSDYVLVISAEDLRRTDGVSISQGLSWERTAKEFMFQMQTNPALRELRRCPCIVVLFENDAAIVWQPAGMSGERTDTATLHFDSQKVEGGYRSGLPGRMFGGASVFVATLAARLFERLPKTENPTNDPRIDLFDAVDSTIAEALFRSRYWLSLGFGTEKKPSQYPVRKVFGNPDEAKGEFKLTEEFSWTDVPPASSPGAADPDGWRIAEPESVLLREQVARQYVRTGKIGLLRCPAAKFGDLLTVDRPEIESLNAVRTLVLEFLDAKSRLKPLCLGVFGPPGAGKSSTVKVVKSVAGDRVKDLTFNVSQFASEDDLIAAFHRARDVSLKGQVPFVFFDEFDCAGADGTQFAWLRSFLAPMNDGEFRDGEEMHPLGKCILVFAGGTASSFEEFETRATRAKPELKGRDFVSRLRGFVNVLGPNRKDADDRGFILRRAVILRNMLETNRDVQLLLNAQKELQIDDGVLRALLLAPKYKHGTRSMAAILDMSRLVGRSRFDQGALPVRDQLAMHVDADAFLELVARPGPQQAEEVELLMGFLSQLGFCVRHIPPARAVREAPWGGIGPRPQTPLISDQQAKRLAALLYQHRLDSQLGRHVAPHSAAADPKILRQLSSTARKRLMLEVHQIAIILRDAGLEIFRPGEPPDWTQREVIDELAQQVNAVYLQSKQEPKFDWKSAAFVQLPDLDADEFDKLSAAKQESNRDHIRTLPRKLHRVGLRCAERPNDLRPKERKTRFQRSVRLLTKKLEQLAILEHLRWVWQSILQDYVYKPGLKNDERRTNPYLRPWSELPADIRRIDRIPARTLAAWIAYAGYDVEELPPQS